MDLWDLIVYQNNHANEKLEGDTPVKEENLSFKVKWQLVKYVIRKSIYWMQWTVLLFLAIWALPIDILLDMYFDMSIDIPNTVLVILFFAISILPTTIRTIYVISHSYILQDKIYIRKIENDRYKYRSRRIFFVESYYCKVYFNKILSDGNVTEHIVKASKEIYDKRNCVEAARLVVFVYKNRPYFMVDDAIKG